MNSSGSNQALVNNIIILNWVDEDEDDDVDVISAFKESSIQIHNGMRWTLVANKCDNQLRGEEDCESLL